MTGRVATLFFLHGVGGGGAAWDRQVAHFTQRGYRCIAWDQPGYGGTPTVEPYDFAQVAEALRRQIGESPVVLIGQSMGGLVAQEAYARFPERVQALALCFTSPAFAGGGEFARQFIGARIDPLDQGRTMAQIAASLMPTMRGTKSEPEGLAHAQRVMSAIPPATYRKAVAMLTSFDRRKDLPKIAVPTLLVAGSDDRIAPAAVMARMAKAIPKSEYRVLQGCGHLGPMDQPQAFNAVLESFLKRL